MNQEKIHPGLRLAVLITVVLIFVALLTVLYFGFALDLFGFRDKSVTEKVTYTVEFESVDPNIANKLVQGAIVRDAAGNSFGTVSTLEADEPATIYAIENGPYAIAQGHPTNLKVILSIEVTANADPELGYSVNGTRIAVGADYEFYLCGVTLTGTCIGLQSEQNNGGVGK